MIIESLDVIIAQHNEFWDFMRAMQVVLSLVFLLGFSIHMLRRWQGRRWQGNLLMLSICGIVLHMAMTASARLGEDVSIRLPLAIAALTLGIICVWEPRGSRERNRKEWDLL